MSREAKSEAQTIGSLQLLLLLHSVPQLGEKALLRLLSGETLHRLSPEMLLELPAVELKAIFDINDRSAAHLAENRAALLESSAELARKLRQVPVSVVSIADAAYPADFERWCLVPPPLLYALGNLTLLDAGTENRHKFTFTIACSRKTGAESLARLDEMATQLAARGGVPVTGHDRPEYQRLALAAQRRGLPTIYVLDRGLREALGPDFDRPPFAAARIRDTAFDAGRDLAISSFRLDDHCIGDNNKRRDGLVAALSDLIIALDVSPGGSMFACCTAAAAAGKLVFNHPESKRGRVQLADEGIEDAPEIDQLVALAMKPEAGT